MKPLIYLCFALLLMHCASAPKPPHCKDDGKGLKPINTGLLKIKAPIHSKAKENHD